MLNLDSIIQFINCINNKISIIEKSKNNNISELDEIKLRVYNLEQTISITENSSLIILRWNELIEFLNESDFQNQINLKVNLEDFESHVENLNIHVSSNDKNNWNNKYDKPMEGIPESDLDELIKNKLNNSYHKPERGIPKSDLSDTVQLSLEKADSSYLKPNSGISKHDLSSEVQLSLNKADSAYLKPNNGIPKNDLSQEVLNSLELWKPANLELDGYVPRSIKGKFLHSNPTTGDLEWVDDTTYNNATLELAGLMSSEDKLKLDGIDALTNSNSITQIKLGENPYIPLNGIVLLPEYPLSLPASDVLEWAKNNYNGTIPSSKLPGYVDDIIELINISSTPPSNCIQGDLYYNTNSKKIFKALDINSWSIEGESPEGGKIYVNLNDNKIYRWGGSNMVIISETLSIGTTPGTALDGNIGNNHIINEDIHVTVGDKLRWNSSARSKSDLQLENVTNDSLVKRSEMGVANGVATLNSSGKVEFDLIPFRADEEDITINNGVLKFKDKSYNSSNFSGFGRKYLRKNILIINGEEKNILSSSEFTESNTIYIILYDFSLNNLTIEIPNNCILQFDGGSISNGIITSSDAIGIIGANMGTDIKINAKEKKREFITPTDSFDTIIGGNNHDVRSLHLEENEVFCRVGSRTLIENIYFSGNEGRSDVTTDTEIRYGTAVSTRTTGNNYPQHNIFRNLHFYYFKKGLELFRNGYENVRDSWFRYNEIGLDITTDGQWVGAIDISNCHFDGNTVGLKIEKCTNFTTHLKKSTFEGCLVSLDVSDTLIVRDCYFGDLGRYGYNKSGRFKGSKLAIVRPGSTIIFENCELNLAGSWKSRYNNITGEFEDYFFDFMFELLGTDENPCHVIMRNCNISLGNMIDTNDFPDVPEYYTNTFLYESLSEKNSLSFENCNLSYSTINKLVNWNYIRLYNGNFLDEGTSLGINKICTINTNNNHTNYIVNGYFDNPKQNTLLSKISRYDNYNNVEILNDKNIYNGNICRVDTYSIPLYYKIPKDLVGKELSFILGLKSWSNSSLIKLILNESDCTAILGENDWGNNIIFNDGYTSEQANGYIFKRTITPTKEFGVLSLLVSTDELSHDYVYISFVKLVESQYEDLIDKGNSVDAPLIMYNLDLESINIISTNTSNSTIYNHTNKCFSEIKDSIKKLVIPKKESLKLETFNLPNTIYIILHDFNIYNGVNTTVNLSFTSENQSSVKTPLKKELDEAIESGDSSRISRAQQAYQDAGSQDYYYWKLFTLLPHQAIYLVDGTILLNDDKTEEVSTDKGRVFSYTDATKNLYIGGMNGTYSFIVCDYLTLPNNCTLLFDGGSIKNGILIGNNTKIEAGLDNIFGTNLSLSGTWNTDEAYVEWFGAKGDNSTDDTDSIRSALYSVNKINVQLIFLNHKKYIITGALNYYNNINSYFDFDAILCGLKYREFSEEKCGILLVVDENEDRAVFKNVERISGTMRGLRFVCVKYDSSSSDHYPVTDSHSIDKTSVFYNCTTQRFIFEKCFVFNFNTFGNGVNFTKITRIIQSRIKAFNFHKVLLINGTTYWPRLIDTFIENNYISGMTSNLPLDAHGNNFRNVNNICFGTVTYNGSYIRNNFIDYYKTIFDPGLNHGWGNINSIGNQYQVFRYFYKNMNYTNHNQSWISFTSKGDVFNWTNTQASEPMIGRFENFADTYVGQDNVSRNVPEYILCVEDGVNVSITDCVLENNIGNVIFIKEPVFNKNTKIEFTCNSALDLLPENERDSIIPIARLEGSTDGLAYNIDTVGPCIEIKLDDYCISTVTELPTTSWSTRLVNGLSVQGTFSKYLLGEKVRYNGHIYTFRRLYRQDYGTVTEYGVEKPKMISKYEWVQDDLLRKYFTSSDVAYNDVDSTGKLDIEFTTCYIKSPDGTYDTISTLNIPPSLYYEPITIYNYGGTYDVVISAAKYKGKDIILKPYLCCVLVALSSSTIKCIGVSTPNGNIHKGTFSQVLELVQYGDINSHDIGYEFFATDKGTAGVGAMIYYTGNSTTPWVYADGTAVS